MQTLADETAAKIAAGDEPASAAVIQALARGVRDLEVASRQSAEREITVRNETAKAAAKVAKGAAKKQGLGAETADFIYREVLGVAK